MAVVSAHYKPGYAGTCTLDTVATKIMGWSAKDSVDTYDASALGDGGFSTTERALRTIEISFKMNVPAAGLPAVTCGNIYAAEFTIDGTIKYAGDWLFKEISPSVNLKGGVELSVTCVNHGAPTTILA